MSPAQAARRDAGFSLVELMVALALGLFVAAGIYLLLGSMQRAGAAQLGLARIQETARVVAATLAADLRRAGALPCAARAPVEVFAQTLADHVVALPLDNATSARAAAPPAGKPFALDRGLFLSGHRCTGSACRPAVPPALGVPAAGQGMGARVPGTDVLTLRYVDDGDGSDVPTDDAGLVCDGEAPLERLRLPAGAAPLGGGHLALLAGCSGAVLFPALQAGTALRPIDAARGVPRCTDIAPHPRLLDFDASLHTISYHLQQVQDETHAGRRIAVLERRVDGVANEVAQGVERFDVRYSLHDAGGTGHWLDAAQTDAFAGQCGLAAAHRCGWGDVDAVDVRVLVDSVDDLPPESAPAAEDFHYSVDSDTAQRPASPMPVTGLPVGHLLRHEVRFVVALRGMAG